MKSIHKKTEGSNKAALTRQFIIEKTAPVFNRKGYTGTTLQDLTNTTGLTKGSIYGNFKDKDEVALAAFEYNVAALLDPIFERMAAQSTALAKLAAWGLFYKENYLKILENGGCPILNTGIESDDTHLEMRNAVRRQVTKMVDTIANILQQGMDNGEVRPGIDPVYYAGLIYSIVEGGMFMTKLMGNLAHIHHAMDHVRQLVARDLKL